MEVSPNVTSRFVVADAFEPSINKPIGMTFWFDFRLHEMVAATQVRPHPFGSPDKRFPQVGRHITVDEPLGTHNLMHRLSPRLDKVRLLGQPAAKSWKIADHLLNRNCGLARFQKVGLALPIRPKPE